MRPSSRALVVLFALAVLCAAVAAAPAAAGQRVTNDAVLLRLINETRARHHLRTVRLNGALTKAALGHARDMMRREYFSHSSPSGGDCLTRARHAGYRTSGCASWAVSEVIAWGMGTLGDPHAVFESWMQSPYHRSIILGGRWRDVGVGSVAGTFRGVSGSLMYTVDFGRRSH
jgi:uncharacterized protein YkwD